MGLCPGSVTRSVLSHDGAGGPRPKLALRGFSLFPGEAIK